MNESCLKNFIPEKNISIDESMMPYYGRHGCKQYIQNKPVKFGYKMWVAATPLGYGIQFYPYAGKDDNCNKDIDLGGSVALTLMSKLPTFPDSHYHGVIDNFFTSPSLEGIERKWYCCYWYSTGKQNRKSAFASS